jgi:tetratricopeptide (TPR) repeat protein
MQAYGVRDVEKLLRLSRATLNALVKAGFVTPTRGARNAWQFSFQDLIVLRTAQALVDAQVPQRRITRSLKELRKNLPASMPLSGLSIAAVGDRVVVREGKQQWQAESGQYLLGFEGDPARGALGVVAADEKKAPPAPSGEDWFAKAAALEGKDTKAAIAAYTQAIRADPERVDARINLGRLLHESRRLNEAERVYVDGIETCGPDPVLLFNLAALLDDRGRRTSAVEVYEAALRVDPTLADAHYNVSLIYEALGKPREAIRHMAQYRKLAR